MIMGLDGEMTSASPENINSYNAFVADQKGAQLGTKLHLGTWYGRKGLES